MATFILLERSRERTRGRARSNAPGNFITKQDAATVYTLTLPPTPSHYIASRLYPQVYSHAVETYDNPPPNPPWIPLGPAAQPQKLDYPATHETPPRPKPGDIPPGTTPVISVRGKPGMTGVLILALTPKQINPSRLVVNSFDILADDANAGNVWYGYSPSVSVNNGFKLIPGAGKELDIADLSQVWFVGDTAGDLVMFDYTE